MSERPIEIGGCMASLTDSAHLCSLDCVPIYCPFSSDGACPAGLEFCPSMHARMCINGEEANNGE